MSSHIFLPLEGVPASLGPGLRTASGAEVFNMMAASEFAGLEDQMTPIDAGFPASEECRGAVTHGISRGHGIGASFVPRPPERSDTIVSWAAAGLKAARNRSTQNHLAAHRSLPRSWNMS